MQTQGNHSIVITGCGWVTPFAAGNIETVLRTGAGQAPDSNNSQGYRHIPDDFLAAHPDLSSECRNDPGAWLTAVAFECTRRDAEFVSGSVPSERVGLVLGNALAGQSGMIDFANEVRQQSSRFVSPIRFPQTVGNYISGALSRAYDIRGPNSTIANGSASGLVAIVEASALLSAGKVDVIFAGGTERLTPTLASGLAEPDVVFSDGACLFVLERREHAVERGATILATIVPSVGQPDTPSLASIFSVAGPLCALTKYAPTLKGVGANDAIYIEHWIGRCLGALGAAAVAAAIGAGRGLAVPMVDHSNSSLISVRRAHESDVPSTKTAVVTAQADDGHQSLLSLTIAGPALRPAEQ